MNESNWQEVDCQTVYTLALVDVRNIAALGKNVAEPSRSRAWIRRDSHEPMTSCLELESMLIVLKSESCSNGCISESPWENGFVESFNGQLRDKLLNREVFDTLRETRILVERYREIYNRVRPSSSLGYRPQAPETVDLSTRTPILAGLT